MYKSLILLVFSFIGFQSYAGQIVGTVAIQGNEAAEDVVVYVEEQDGRQVSPPDSQPVLDQRNLRFIPHVLPVIVGTTVQFRNSDNVAHNIFTPSPAGDMFNLGTWKGDQVKTHTFDKPGEVLLLCNLHPEMEAFIYAVPTPYFAKTDPEGSYTIREVPQGTYTLKIWSEYGTARPSQVTVSALGAVEINFTVK